MKLIIILTILLSVCIADAQSLYIKAFGNNSNEPIIFLHGGPGYNSTVFEALAADELSKNGFYVIVYDRRGEGRSTDSKANFTFNETFDDLNSIYTQFGIKKASLIGHSFGGIVASLYAEKFPEKINSIFLVGAPVSLQETFRTIIKSCRKIYIEKKDSVQLNYLNTLEKMDTASIEYSSYCFSYAMLNNFYSPKKLMEEASSLYKQFKTDSLLIKYASKMTYEAPRGFMENESYTTIDLTSNLRNLLSKNIRIFGMYGKEDGLYSEDQINELSNLIGSSNIKYFENCSHSVFVDRRQEFISYIKAFIK